jgi:hypothetical protein
MMKAGLTALFALGLSVVVPGSASACSVFVRDEDNKPERWRADAREAVDRATAIIDGEVIRPFVPGKQNALVRAHRTFKGPQQEVFEVGERTTCDIALMHQGERRRMLLHAGPALYYLSSLDNPKYEDEILGSDRNKDWPYRPGQSPASPRP